MGISEGMKNLFKSKVEKKNKEDAAKKSGIPEWITDMPEGTDKDRAMAVHLANEKKETEYNDGGVKYSKLKDKLKKK